MVSSNGIVSERNPEVLGTYLYMSFDVKNDHLVYIKHKKEEIDTGTESYYLVKQDQKWFVSTASDNGLESFSWFGNYVLIGKVFRNFK